ncbi:prolyl oligopeptidase family serine peptidase [Blastomonas sp. SL216]|uniref:prolyl oligopeptidase family serine peptidase n=1 Tax=Blastomonas sp. SL216 TaxID=2995169 RepID=UPI00237708FE|nr:prolyl oligopeptidase family serine peptidase [Blastomonas sp. SL216]
MTLTAPPPMPLSASTDRRSLLCGLTSAGLLAGLPGAPAWAGGPAASGARSRTIHGVTITDPFGWLDEASLDDPEVAALMANLAAASEQVMTPLAGLVQRLRAEADAATPSAPPPAPVVDGDHGYWSAWGSGGRQLWRAHRVTGKRELLLDAAEPAADGKPIGDFVAWGLSDDGKLLAFATMSAPEHHDIRFKHVATGRMLTDIVRDVGVQITSERIIWRADSRSIIYGEVDAAGRPWRARIHRIGHLQADGPVLFEETDPAFFVEIRQTTSRRFALINSVSVDTSEVRLLARSSLQAPRLVSARRAGRGYAVDHGGGGALDILTNDTHPNFRLVRATLAEPDRWSEVLSAQDRTGLTWHQAFKRHLVVAERNEGISRVRVLDRAARQWRAIAFPDAIAVAGFDRWTAGPEANREPDPARLRLGVESLAAPRTLFDYRFADATLEPLQAGSSAAAGFVSERLFATAPDGTAIPMSMIRPHGQALRGAVLYGYGAYGVPSNPDFDPQRLSLLTRGVAYIIAHVRGGGDLGGAWHDAGRAERRAQPVEDFIACARALTAQGIVPAGRIVSMGRSAGGWLVGAALNRAPDLWAGVMADVPFVDVLTSLVDPRSPVAAAELSEVGDVARDPAAFARALRLCAYQNIPSAGLPPVYLTASLADVRIAWSGVLKYAARLRAAHPDNAVVLRLDRDGNHWGPADPATGATWRAERIAFTLEALSIA